MYPVSSFMWTLFQSTSNSNVFLNFLNKNFVIRDYIGWQKKKSLSYWLPLTVRPRGSYWHPQHSRLSRRDFIHLLDILMKSGPRSTSRLCCVRGAQKVNFRVFLGVDGVHLNRGAGMTYLCRPNRKWVSPWVPLTTSLWDFFHWLLDYCQNKLCDKQTFLILTRFVKHDNIHQWTLVYSYDFWSVNAIARRHVKASWVGYLLM